MIIKAVVILKSKITKGIETYNNKQFQRYVKYGGKIYKGEITVRNNRDEAISFFNQAVVKKEHELVSFQILHPTIYSSKSFNL